MDQLELRVLGVDLTGGEFGDAIYLLVAGSLESAYWLITSGGT